MDMAARVTGDPAFGLHCGMHSERGDLELLEYLLSSCNTLGDTLEVAVRYQRLLNDVIHHEVIEHGEHIVWGFRLPDGQQALEDFLVAWTTQLTRRCSGVDVPPIQVRFVHPPGPYAEECERYFRAPIVYGAEYTSVVMGAGALRLPFVTGDPVLHRLLRAQADAMLATIPIRDSFQRRVRTLVEAELPRGGANLEQISRKARTSVSTLRRRLREEGALFGTLVEQVQQSTAQRCLSDPKLTMREIAERAGFATVPAFHRAFVRWFGETPARYRKTHEHHPASAWLTTSSDD
jgi:AraC-like DNA-binding protein